MPGFQEESSGDYSVYEHARLRRQGPAAMRETVTSLKRMIHRNSRVHDDHAADRVASAMTARQATNDQ